MDRQHVTETIRQRMAAGILPRVIPPLTAPGRPGAPTGHINADTAIGAVEWRGQPVWILRRTKEMLEEIKQTDGKVADPQSERKKGELTPEYARNEFRSIKPEYLVVVGICTHLGCSPQDRLKAGPEAFDSQWRGGFYCPCHGSLFDLAGRVYKNKPAPDNLKVPPYTYLSDTRILIGEDKKRA